MDEGSANWSPMLPLAITDDELAGLRPLSKSSVKFSFIYPLLTRIS